MASKKGKNVIIPKYFMAVRNCIFFCSSKSALYGLVIKWNEPIIHFPFMIWKEFRPSP